MKKYVQTQKGITLIEMILYMSIFTVLVVIVISTVFYLQKIFSDKKDEYAVRTQMVGYLDLLQQHLNTAESISLEPNGFILYMYANTDSRALKKVRQYLESGKIVLEYVYDNTNLNKKISVFKFTELDKFDINHVVQTGKGDTLASRSLLEVHISWHNRKARTVFVQGRLYVPNQQ